MKVSGRVEKGLMLGIIQGDRGIDVSIIGI